MCKMLFVFYFYRERFFRVSLFICKNIDIEVIYIGRYQGLDFIKYLKYKSYLLKYLNYKSYQFLILKFKILYMFNCIVVVLKV